MTAQWQAIQDRHDSLMAQVTSPGLESSERHKLQKELSHLTNVLRKYKQIDGLIAEQEAVQEQSAQNTDSEMAQLDSSELEEVARTIEHEQKLLDELILPQDALDNRSVYVEIRSGAGGQEAALFVVDLLKMYTNYAIQKGWRASVESTSETDLGGYREAVLYIQGKDVYGHLKRESGVHRVQRVPATETQGRVHTSTATVAVLPEAQAIDTVISSSDLRIDVFRASGAGGQHVNTTDSAVRITHIPTGVVVSCQDERSQHKNKAKALKRLEARILAARQEEHEMKMSKERKDQVGTGMRAEKVRTYNFPQNRVTDHQVNLTLKKLDMVIEGNMDEIIVALRENDRERRKAQFLARFK